MKTESIFFHIDKPDMLPVGVKYENLKELDGHNDNSLESIMLQDVLDYVGYDNIIALLELCFKKNTSNGTISIQGVDLHKISSAITFKEIDDDIAKKILYRNYKRSIHNRNDIVSILKSIGYIIDEQKYINIFEYYIEAHKI